MTVYVKSSAIIEAIRWTGENFHEIDAFVNRGGKNMSRTMKKNRACSV